MFNLKKLIKISSSLIICFDASMGFLKTGFCNPLCNVLVKCFPYIRFNIWTWKDLLKKGKWVSM